MICYEQDGLPLQRIWISSLGPDKNPIELKLECRIELEYVLKFSSSNFLMRYMDET